LRSSNYRFLVIQDSFWAVFAYAYSHTSLCSGFRHSLLERRWNNLCNIYPD